LIAAQGCRAYEEGCREDAHHKAVDYRFKPPMLQMNIEFLRLLAERHHTDNAKFPN